MASMRSPSMTERLCSPVLLRRAIANPSYSCLCAVLRIFSALLGQDGFPRAWRTIQSMHLTSPAEQMSCVSTTHSKANPRTYLVQTYTAPTLLHL